MAFKRARLASDDWGGFTETVRVGRQRIPAASADSFIAAGAELRDFLIGKHVAGDMPAADICKIAYWHAASGGVGLDDLSYSPQQADRHGNEHIRGVLNRTYQAPDLEYVDDVPIHDKHASRRTTTPIPIRLASATLARDYAALPDVPAAMLQADQHEAYEKHPVVVQAPDDAILVPVSLYWDGVMYSKRDSVLAFYFRDLRRQINYLSWFVSSELGCVKRAVFNEAVIVACHP